MTLEEITMILGQAKLVFPNVALTVEAFRMWHKLFEQESPVKFEAAIIALLKEPGRVFFPTPGEVTATITDMLNDVPPSEELWLEAISLAQNGYDESRMFDHMSKLSTNAAYALRSVGWERVRYGDLAKELPFARRDFMAAMENYKHYEQLETNRNNAKVLLSEIARTLGGANGGRLQGLPSMVESKDSAPRASRGNELLHQSAPGK